jgi:RNA polymerase sigma-70 factor, ECF subfamily
MVAEETRLEDLQNPLREINRQFIRLIEPHLPDLFRYCRRLTGSLFDAEDLLQEALARSLGRLHQFYQPIDARKYLFRVVTNLWIDQQRRAQLIDEHPIPSGLDVPDDLPNRFPELVDAAERLIALLEPRQRVAVVLKDAFGFSVEEISGFLECTPGAVKGLLHRGRERLRTGSVQEQIMSRATDPSDQAHRRLVHAYAEHFSNQEWDELLQLLRSDARVEILGVDEEHGRDWIRNTSLAETAKEHLPGHRAEVVELEGEPVMLWLFKPDDGPEAIRDIVRFRSDGEYITTVREYWFCPDLIRAVGEIVSRRAEPDGSYYV